MKTVRLIVMAVMAAAWFAVFSIQLGFLPPLGKVLDPFSGFWQNAETHTIGWPETQNLSGLEAEVRVAFDDRRVPHIFANTPTDLMYVQGYLEARDRLWQMDFLSSLAGGELSRFAGKPTLPIDRFFRRLGMVKAAKQDLAIINSNPEERQLLEAYTKGVNAYINSLSYSEYPVEYKLLDYKPTTWTPLRTVLIIKLMTFNLAWNNQDVQHTQALQWYGREAYDQLYPDFPNYREPVVSGKGFYPDSIIEVDTPVRVNPVALLPYNPPLAPHPGNGSNNWVLVGNKTASGFPMLANDPHLGLNIPSIWYELQLKNGTYDMYGVSIPGVPGIIIGFNEDIAIGLTNAQRDVTDWYNYELIPGQQAYLTGNSRHTLVPLVEEFEVKGGRPFIDTVWYTHVGPVVFDTTYPGDSLRMGLTMQWIAHEPGSFLKSLLALNQGHTFDDYQKAISSHVSPAQNFAFASRKGDIAITQQGKFPVFWPTQGKFIGDLNDSTATWKAFIPPENNPSEHNPKRGYLSSANQHPTHPDYPYYYHGSFEFYRNQRINQVLDSLLGATPQDMMALQNDNLSLFARDAIQIILPKLEERIWDEQGRAWLDKLKNWDCTYEGNDEIAPFFEAWWHAFEHLGKDTERLNNISLPDPKEYIVLGLIDSVPGHPYFDLDSTDRRETATDALVIAFEQSVHLIDSLRSSADVPITWASYKGTHLTHWLNALKPFDVRGLPIGGNRLIVNATTADHGPSWRMIVSLEEPVRAWGVYPGGQSGNPGSPFYDQFVSKWAEGSYYPLLYLFDPEAANDRIIFRQTFAP